MRYVLLLATVSYAQSLIPTVAPIQIGAGKSVNVALTFNSGGDPVVAIQWNTNIPASSMIVWTIGDAAIVAMKSLTCNLTGSICVMAGLNTTLLPIGNVIATGVLSLAPGLRGIQTVSIQSVLAADASAMNVPVTGGSVSVTVLSPFDLNSDGLVNSVDLGLAILQVLSVGGCGTADFNRDGVCTVADVVALVVDALGPNP